MAQVTREPLALDRCGSVEIESAAFFLDFDGTLAAIASRPDDVVLTPHMRDLLLSLWHRADAAVAVLSGRDIATLDSFPLPPGIPLGASHGLEIRSGDGSIERAPIDADALEVATRTFTDFARRDENLLVETKPASVTLHYRNAPSLAADVEALARSLVQKEKGLSLLKGKMVVELKAGRADKGGALARLMENPPFKGRVPVAVGDDITDEAAFEIAQALGGVAIKIGDGETAARYRADTMEDFHDWLGRQLHEKSHTVRSTAP